MEVKKKSKMGAYIDYDKVNIGQEVILTKEEVVLKYNFIEKASKFEV